MKKKQKESIKPMQDLYDWWRKIVIKRMIEIKKQWEQEI